MKIKTIGRIQISFGGILFLISIVAILSLGTFENWVFNSFVDASGIALVSFIPVWILGIIITFIFSIMFILQGMVNEKNETLL